MMFLPLLLSAAAPSLHVEPARPVAPGVPVLVDSIADFEKERAKVHGDLADGLYEVGKWCHKKKWYAERDRIYREVLLFDPDHRSARKALGFERKRDGSWVVKDEPEAERNRGRVDLDAIDEKMADALEEWRVATHELLGEHASELSEEQKRAEYQLIVDRFDDDEVAHKALGHVPGWKGKPWVSPEFKNSYERRKSLKEIVDAALKSGAKVEELEAREFEAELTWVKSGKNSRARAFARVAEEDVVVAVALAQAAEALVQKGLELDVELPEGLTLYMMEDNAQLIEVAAAHPEFEATGLDGVGALWLDWRSMVTWGEETVIRADAVSRQTVSWLLKHKYGLLPKQGWAYEGVGLYLSYRTCGTRLRFYVSDNDYGDGADRSDMLRDPNVDWLDLALDVMVKEPPNLAFVLGKEAPSLTEKELLVSYALGAYLVEARPEDLKTILSRITKEPSTVVLEEVLGKDLDGIGAELRRWLKALQ